jgi:hypothetical protein
MLMGGANALLPLFYKMHLPHKPNLLESAGKCRLMIVCRPNGIALVAF